VPLVAWAFDNADDIINGQSSRGAGPGK
jgi:hypothetical protein